METFRVSDSYGAPQEIANPRTSAPPSRAAGGQRRVGTGARRWRFPSSVPFVWIWVQGRLLTRR